MIPGEGGRSRAYSHRLIALARHVKKMADTGTQRIRSKLLSDLERMFEMAETCATDSDLDARERQTWTRIAAYIGQVMNSLTKTFDEAEVTKELEVLEKMVNEAVAKGKDQGTQKEAS